MYLIRRNVRRSRRRRPPLGPRQLQEAPLRCLPGSLWRSGCWGRVWQCVRTLNRSGRKPRLRWHDRSPSNQVMHFGSMSTNFGRTVSLTVHAFYSELSKSKTAKALGEQMVRDESVFEWLSRSTMREDGEERKKEQSRPPTTLGFGMASPTGRGEA
jgi:hypothetical protein